MSYRRTKQQAIEAKRWREFCDRHAKLIQGAAVPESLMASEEMFDDLLMHGVIDHHPDPTRFNVDRLTAAQRAKFRDLVFAYFVAGYGDPGLMVLSVDDREKLRKKYPEQFGSHRRDYADES
jgi:hypothetical protein